MGLPIKVFILGSCVSRDPFELADNRDFDVVGYYARSSFASLGATSFVDEKILSEVKSNWQRRMVRADMEKSVFSVLKKTDFDVLLIDLIDERFSLSVKGSSVHTISTEYKKALYKPNSYGFIEAGSEEKLTLWREGLERISRYLVKHGLDDKVIVNKVYWSLRCQHPEKLLDRYSEAQFKQANEQLEWMYEEIKKTLPKARFVTYSNEELEIDEQHKWGLDPFHYSRRTFLKQLSSIYSLSLKGVRFTIKHNLGNKVVAFPIDWRADPFKSRSWMHHFSSLRWLNSSYSYLLTLSILTSFYKFHCEKKIKNPYYNEVRGDHTAAVRLGILISIEKEYGAHADSSIKNIVRRLIVQEIKNLQSDKMYRSGHNHGLKVDLSLLNLVLGCPEYKPRVNLELVLERSAKTLDAMWHASGLTKEHSVSYQEYNLPLTVEYFELLEKLNVESLASVSLENVVDESRRFLGYALKASAEYFPLGDSFRLPNEKILNKVFGQGEVKSAYELLMPYSEEEGVYCNKNFFIFRKTVNGRKVHFAATCCWDSHVHKQNDELSFCLEVDGVTIFDDPGYTEFLPWEGVKKLQSEASHSTVTASGAQWGDVRFPNGKSRILSSQHDVQGFSLSMSMERYGGFKIVREVKFKDDVLSVADKVTGHELYDQKFKRKLVFGCEVAVSNGEQGRFEIEGVNGRKIAELQMEEKNVELSEAEVVLADRKLVKNTQVIIAKNKLVGNNDSFFPALKLKLAPLPGVSVKFDYDDACFVESFYYEANRPKNVDEIIELSKGFLGSELVSEQRRAAAGVVGVYKSIEFGRWDELKFLQRSLYKMLPSIFSTAATSKRVKGVRDDPKQVAISVSTALWHSEIMLGIDPVYGLANLRDEVSDWKHLEVPYSQNVARAITLLSYIHFSRREYDESLHNIEWMASFVSKINKEVNGFRGVNSSYCGDYHKAVGLLQLCIAGREWINNDRKREKYWSPKAIHGLCPRVRKGVSPEFDKKFINLLKN